MFGEFISVLVAVSWTVCALFFEYAGRRIGSTNLNLVRLLFAFVLLGISLLAMSGSFFPLLADTRTWLWMGVSGVVGFVIGDYFLFYSYTLITARFSQLIMTLAPPFAALSGWLLLGESLSPLALAGMCVTLCGIAISIYSKSPDGNSPSEVPEVAEPLATASGGSGRDDTPEMERPIAHVSLPVQKKAATENSSDNGSNENTGKKMPLPGKFRLELPLKGVVFAVIGALGQGVGIVLSKQGMIAYQQALPVFPAEEISGGGTAAFAQSPLYIPFAATQMRIMVGILSYFILIGCTLGLKQFFNSFKNRKGIGAAFYGSVFGPFLGVSLSLMAVRYTNSAVASTIMATVPILILIPDKLIFKRKVTPQQILGAVISVAGVAMFFLKF